MVHSAVQQPMEVYITYDDRLRPEADGEALGIKPATRSGSTCGPSGYPVFNVQRDFGGEDGKCTWPKEECAAFDPCGNKDRRPGPAGQRQRRGPQAAGRGRVVRARSRTSPGGTLIGIGGHLHPGGTPERDRPGPRRQGANGSTPAGRLLGPRRQDASRAARRPRGTSRCAVTGLPYWGVHVEPGDALRSNATYDTTIQSTYENMGIAVALLVPDDADGNAAGAGRRPVHGAGRPSEALRSGGLRAARPTLCPNGVLRDARPLRRERQLRRAARATLGRGRGRGRPTRSRSPTSSTRRATCRTIETTRHPDGEAGPNAAVHQRRRRGDLPHGHVVRVPVPRPDRDGVPARRRRRRAWAGRSTSTRPSSASACPRSAAAKNELDSGACRSPRRRATSPARSSPTSAASIRRCGAPSRSPIRSAGTQRKSRSGSPDDQVEEVVAGPVGGPAGRRAAVLERRVSSRRRRRRAAAIMDLPGPRGGALAAQVRDEPARSSCAPRRPWRSASGRSTR